MFENAQNAPVAPARAHPSVERLALREAGIKPAQTFASRRTDQAAGLRRMLGTLGPRVLPVAGGADGRERARVAVDIALAASELGQSVVILDQSRGEVARVLDARPRYELYHLLTGEKQFRDVARDCPGGLRLVAAARGIAEIAARPNDAAAMFVAFARVETPASLVVLNIDDAAVAARLMPQPDAEVLLVSAASAASITGAYAHVKQMMQAGGISNYRVLLADGEGLPESRHSFEKLASTARRFLRARLEFGGELPRQRDSTRRAGQATPGAAMRRIAASLSEWNLFEPGAMAH